MSSARDYLAEREESREWARRTVEKHAPLVNRIARHLLARMPANVQIDDLVQSGMIGLLDAAKKYDHTKGASFETYAGIRIQGAMLDEVRKGDWTPRSVHRKSREVAKAIQKIEARTGRNASEKEIAGELKIDLDTYFNILKDSSGTRLFSFDEINESADPALELVEGDLPDPADNMQQGPLPRRSGECHRHSARAREAGALALLRRRTQPQGNRRNHRCERIPGEPDPQPRGPAAALETLRLALGAYDAGS